MSTASVRNVRTLRRPAHASSGAGRVRTNWPARIKVGTNRTTCTVMDMSNAGACLAFEDALEQDATLWLVIDRFPPISATVAWRKRDRVGLRFREEQEWVQHAYKKRFDATAWLNA